MTEEEALRLWNDDGLLEAWTLARLDELDAEDEREFANLAWDTVPPIPVPREPLRAATAYGVLARLGLSEYFRPSKRPRGRPVSQIRMQEELDAEIAGEAVRIRRLWKNELGKKNRSEASGRITAEKIAHNRIAKRPR